MVNDVTTVDGWRKVVGKLTTHFCQRILYMP